MTLTKLILASFSLLALVAADVATGTTSAEWLELTAAAEILPTPNGDILAEEIVSTTPMTARLIVDERGLPAVVAINGALSTLESVEKAVLATQMIKDDQGYPAQRHVLYLNSKDGSHVAFTISEDLKSLEVLSGEGIVRAVSQPVAGGIGHLVVTLIHEGSEIEVVLVADSLHPQSEGLARFEEEQSLQDQIKQR